MTFANAGTFLAPFLADVRQIVDAPAPASVVDAAPAGDARAVAPGASTEAIDVGRVLAALRVTTGADGALTIHAPREAASTLASLLRGLADALASVTP